MSVTSPRIRQRLGAVAALFGFLLGAWPGWVWTGCFQAAEAAQDRDAPRVRIVEPAERAFLSGVQRVVVRVTDNVGVARVTVSKDGVLLNSDLQPPYELGWDTRLDADGPHTFVARARDMDWNEGVSAVVHVTVDNALPRAELLSPKDGQTLVGTIALEASAADSSEIASVAFLLDNGEIATREVPPYTAQWDSKNALSGQHAMQVRATDRAGNTATSAPFTVRVANVNAPPHLSPIEPKVVQEGLPLAFTLEAADADDIPSRLTFRASNLPPWATFDPATGAVSGTPGHDEASAEQPTKVYSGVVFEVCDPEPVCDRQQTTVTVEDANRPPVITDVGEQLINEGVYFTMPLSATDPDGDALTCAASALPPWMSFDVPTCTLKGVPGFEIASHRQPRKTYPRVHIQVCDAHELCESRSLPITVVDVNRPPVWERIGHQHVDEEELLRVTVRAHDPDGDPEVLVASPLPHGSTFTDNKDGTGTFSWKPRADQGGRYEVVFTATDGTLSDHGAVTITVRETILTVSGMIIQDTGAGYSIPFAGVVVEFQKGAEPVAQAVTDRYGMYLAVQLRPGTYTVRPTNQTKEEFTVTAKKLRAITASTFVPLHRVVTMTDRDVTGVDFSASH